MNFFYFSHMYNLDSMCHLERKKREKGRKKERKRRKEAKEVDNENDLRQNRGRESSGKSKGKNFSGGRGGP